ncbi:hypothetical protein [Sorangium sp. So ce363]|uniref:hypothetical protein n=1 Tax=Sorangium sp. So ce363 TaxID=3133304 RepID=UPI003F60E508
MSGTWAGLARSFHFVSATDLLRGERFEHFQSRRDRGGRLDFVEPPLCLLFVSHRWETVEDPDPRQRQFRALRRFLELVVPCVRACLVPPDKRAEHLPSLDTEGTVQALDAAFRILELEPLEPAFVPAETRRSEATTAASKLGLETPAFAEWLTSRIAVWIDYTCVPQPPRGDDETSYLLETLRRLPDLMRASTLLALRYAGDDYGSRGWCATESFLASPGPSGRSFARNLFIDIDALLEERPLYMPSGVRTDSRPGSEEAAIMQESFDLAIRAVTQARDLLMADPLPYIRSSPPRMWSEYVSLLSVRVPPIVITQIARS